MAASSLFAALADQLQGGDAQIPDSFSLFFRFAGGGTGYRYVMSDVFVKLDAAAAKLPSLAVFAGDENFAPLVTFSYATCHVLQGLRRRRLFLLIFLTLRSVSLRLYDKRTQAYEKNGYQLYDTFAIFRTWTTVSILAVLKFECRSYPPAPCQKCARRCRRG